MLSLILTESCSIDFHPGYDADVCTLLKAAFKPYIVGKTNMDEFGMGSFGVHSAFGPTILPQSEPNQPRVAGGSSSGSAAVVASGLVDLYQTTPFSFYPLEISVGLLPQIQGAPSACQLLIVVFMDLNLLMAEFPGTVYLLTLPLWIQSGCMQTTCQYFGEHSQ
jgi:Amidase